MAKRFSVNYLLEDTALYGGVKIVLHQANLLARRGHTVTVVSKGERPRWIPLAARFLQVQSFTAGTLPDADVTVATFWTTIRPAHELAGARAVHYCQGFEAIYTHNQAEHPAILEAYSTPIAGWGLSPHLAELLHTRFGRPAIVVPPAVTSQWRPAWRLGPRSAPRIVVLHPWEADWKGVRAALLTVRRLREMGIGCRLVRISQWPLGAEEKALVEADEVHVNIPPDRVAGLLRGADLLLAPSWEQEGFGLPVLEAMACGVPVVASEISAFRAYAQGAAMLCPPEDVEAFAAAAQAVLGDRATWLCCRRAGIEAARAFSEARTADIAEEAVAWVAEGRFGRQITRR
ncbi:MAG: glycosyltransferase [Thermoanaerobaculaceae bacterium]|jgi:glycosyltransferase involved in cell wall biosynthesis|nr:glycosyltransferase [Thermoanaerobaculaceae bacterium]